MGNASEKKQGRGRLLDSAPIRFLTSQRGELAEPDLLRRWEQRLTAELCRCYTGLRLSRVLEGSFLLRPGFWILLTMSLLPFLPTMAALGLCAVTMASVLLRRCDARTGEGPARFQRNLYSPGLRLIGLLSLIYLAAIGLSVSPGRSLRPGLLMAFFMLFSFATYGAVAHRRSLRRCFSGIILGAAAVSLYGLWQWLHPEAYTTGWLDTDMFSSITFRVYSTLRNPNVLGEFFLLTIPFALALALTETGWPKRLLWAAALGLMGVCAVLTYSRGCYLGLILGLMVFLVLLDRRFLIPIAVFAVLSPFILPHAVMDRLLSVGDLSDTSTDYRFKIWQGVFAMLRDFWYCGVGPGEGAFYSVYPVYALEAIDAPHTHCLYLQLLSDTGIAGLAVFLAFAGSLFRSLLTALRTACRRETRIFAMAGISAFSGFLLQSFTDYSFYNYRVMLLFFGLAGLCLLLRHMDALPEEETEKPGRSFCPADLALLAVLAAGAGLLIWGTVRQEAAAAQTTPEQLLEDLRRSDRRYNTQTLTETEYYVISYTLEMTGMDPAYCDNYPGIGETVYDAYNKAPVGSLEEVSFRENEDGTVDISLRLSQYTLFTKVSISTPSGYVIRVGGTMYLENEAGKYLGSGTVRWISH